MGIKEQFKTLKDNWLLIAIVVVVFIFVSGVFSGNGLTSSIRGSGQELAQVGGASYSKMAYDSISPEYPMPDEGFAPGETVRKVVKTSSMSTEVERGMFYESENELLGIVESSGSYLLNQNVNKYGTDKKSYYTGSYQIKVDVKKYDSVIAQLKGIGEVQSFSENSEDVTERYTDLKIEIESEKARLKRYEAMYAEATIIADKIELNDRIFNLERSIKYMEDALANIDERVDYSTVYVTINEKRSDYADMVFVKFSETVKLVVESTNTLVKFLLTILPWALAFFIIRFVVKKARKS